MSDSEKESQRKDDLLKALYAEEEKLHRIIFFLSPIDKDETAPQDVIDAWNQQILNRFHINYVKTSNPLFAWNAYAYCRSREVQLPEWFFQYLDDFLEQLGNAVESKSSRSWGTSILEGLGLNHESKKTQFVDMVRTFITRHSEYDSETLARLKTDPYAHLPLRYRHMIYVQKFVDAGHPIDHAIRLASEKYGVSEGTLKRHYYDYRPRTYPKK